MTGTIFESIFEHFETGFPDVSVTLEVSQLKSRDNTFKAELCASKVNPSKQNIKHLKVIYFQLLKEGCRYRSLCIQKEKMR